MPPFVTPALSAFLRTAAPGRSRVLVAALRAVAPLAAASLAAAPLAAQDVRIFRMPEGGERHMIVRSDDRPMIGVTTAAESERGDTLGLRIEQVQPGSPAEKAGLKAGDRLQSVNGVSLRADRADAGEEDYSGVLNRRLQREVQRTAEGQSVELRVLTGAQARTVRVTPEKASAFMRESEGMLRMPRESVDRAVLGLTVTSTGTPRDTIGVFVQSVASDGPAEKAGIVEGDRIAAINGVSLKVAAADAEDEAVGAVRVDRLMREMAKLKAGDVAELTVVTAGRARTVRVTTVKAGDLPAGAEGAFMFTVPDVRVLRDKEPQVFEFRGRTPELPEMEMMIPEMRRRIEEQRQRVPMLRSRRAVTISA